MSSTKLLIVFIIVFFVASEWLEVFFIYVLPAIYSPFLEGKLWLTWLIVGGLNAPIWMFIAYVSIRVTGSSWQFDKTQWKIAIIGMPLALLYLTGLGYVFSLFVPSSLEPYRSLMLPAIVLAVTFILFSRTKYSKKYQLRKLTMSGESC
jgi:hypothetical protein